MMGIPQVKVFLVIREAGVLVSNNLSIFQKGLPGEEVSEAEIPYFSAPENFEEDALYFISNERLLVS